MIRTNSNVYIDKVNLKKATICTILSIMLAFSLLLSFPIGSNKAFADPDLQAQLDAAQEELESQQEYINKLQIEADEANAKVAEIQSQIDDTQDEINKNNTQICSLAIRQYKIDPLSQLVALMESGSLNEMLFSLQTMEYLSAKDADTIKKAFTLKQSLESSYEEMSATANELNRKLDESVEESNDLQNKVDDLNNKLAEANKPPIVTVNSTEEHKSSHYSPDPAPYLGSVVATAIAIAGPGTYPYVFGASGPNAFDCSGFVSWCYGGGGRRLWVSQDIYYCRCGWYEVSASEAVPGDVVATEGHVGIYIGGGQMAEAACPERGVCISSVRGSAYRRKG